MGHAEANTGPKQKDAGFQRLIQVKVRGQGIGNFVRLASTHITGYVTRVENVNMFGNTHSGELFVRMIDAVSHCAAAAESVLDGIRWQYDATTASAVNQQPSVRSSLG